MSFIKIKRVDWISPRNSVELVAYSDKEETVVLYTNNFLYTFGVRKENIQVLVNTIIESTNYPSDSNVAVLGMLDIYVLNIDKGITYYNKKPIANSFKLFIIKTWLYEIFCFINNEKLQGDLSKSVCN